MINKDRWVEIMQAAGFSEEDMRSWNVQYETVDRAANRAFL